MPTYDDTAFRRMRGELVTLAGLTLKVGVVGPGASALEEGSSMTLAELMLVHEYGTDTIPARAPIAKTMYARRADIAALHIRAFKAVLSGEMDARKALGLIGVQVVAWIKETIRAGLTPPNAPSTIARKGSSTPLVDDGQLINSIHFEIVEVAKAAVPAPGSIAA